MEHEVIVTLLVILLIAIVLMVVTSALTAIKSDARMTSPGLIMLGAVGLMLAVAFLAR